MRKVAAEVLVTPQLIIIDRRSAFDPIAFLREHDPSVVVSEWKIREQDERSLALTEFDPARFRFETGLKGSESSIRGEERLRRLKAMPYIRPDAKILHTFWEEMYRIPKSWKHIPPSPAIFIHFDGTIFEGPNGDLWVLSLCFSDRLWEVGRTCLEHGLDVYNPSVVLKAA